jgi:hypothetical protein
MARPGSYGWLVMRTMSAELSFLTCSGGPMIAPGWTTASAYRNLRGSDRVVAVLGSVPALLKY